MTKPKGKVAQIERDLETLWRNYQVKPTMVAMTLENLRTFVKGRRVRPDIRDFLRRARKSTHGCVVLTGRRVGFVDDNGRPITIEENNGG